MLDNVVIIGGSLSGIIMAKTLAPYFRKVIMLDKDDVLGQGLVGHRKAVAQSSHAHILLNQGLTGLNDLLPGFTEMIVGRGAVRTDATRDWRSLFPHGWLPIFESGVEVVCLSRPLLETTLRDLAKQQIPNLEIQGKTVVRSVALAKNEPHRLAVETDGHLSYLDASFVVDTSGRMTLPVNTLAAAGYAAPSIETSKAFIGYSTARISSAKLPEGIRAYLIMAKDPDRPFGGVLMPIENGQYLATLYGFNKHYPPRDPVDFLACANSLRANGIHDAIRDCLVEDVKTLRKEESYLCGFGERGPWPASYLVAGDAVSSFNPIYGQGITASANAARAVKALLVRDGEILVRAPLALQKAITKAYRAAWLVSGSEDLRWPGTEASKRPFGIGALHRMSDRISHCASRNKDVALAYVKVLHMMEPPTSLFAPAILSKLIRP